MRPTEVETDRRAFIGRGRTIAEAAAFEPGAKLSGSQGFTLDPCMALRRGLRIPAGKRVRIIFWTLAAPSRAELEEAVARYRHADSFTHEMMQAWTRAQVQSRHVGISSQEAADFQRLARYLIYPDLHLRAGTESFSAGLKQQSALWPLGISGDYPICLLRINDETDLDIARKALLGQEYLRARGLVADLVIVNERASSYIQDMQAALESMCENARLRGTAQGPRQHIFAVRHDLMSQETYEALLASARIVLHARNGKLATQIERVSREAAEAVAEEKAAGRGGGFKEIADIPAGTGRPHHAAAAIRASEPPAPPKAEPAIPRGDDLVFWNGYGGFTEDGSEYVVRLAGGSATPHPWINVISNGDFGFHVAAEGGGYSWSANSRDYQLTPWTNDPVTNRPGEAVHVVDLDSATVFSPFATLDDDPGQLFEARHGQGYSIFSTVAGRLKLELTQLVDPERSLKLSRFRLENGSGERRRLRVYLYAEWVLGNNRGRTAPFILPGFDEASGAVTATNPYSLDYAGRTAFLASDHPVSSFTTSRRDFLGRNGSITRPASVFGRAELDGSLESDGDPCAAIAVDVTLEPGAARDLVFALGDAGEGAVVADLAALCTGAHFDACLAKTKENWASFLGTLQVETPDEAMNFMVNRWLPYQGLACRIRARAAFYQASGAYGFRDQLQDTLAFLLHEPALARDQILNAAGRQFREGDVQHWWLPRTGAGVRTMIADDVVWLAYAAAHYVGVTGDEALLDENLPFLEGPALEPGQHDSFFQPETSGETAPIYEHCARALDLAVARTGEHGLPLILGGDWNDGMNRVGDEGKGESVWLGWFLAHALDNFMPIAERRSDGERVRAWAEHRERLKAALESAGWDGSYYRRGYFDDGSPLGSSENEECRIDSIAQSWSVLSGLGDPEHSRQAMDAVVGELVDREAGIIRLFTPPFTDDEPDPGYIKGYPPGVRENGGQYTHAATWVVYALARMGRGDEAHACFDMLNPVGHALDRESAERYRVEPYVVAADVYSGDGREGRGGWTWYTGSGGWLYRTAVEAILGIRREGSKLIVEPVLPASWPGYKAALKLDGQTYAVEVTRKDGGYDIRVNEKPFSGASAAIDLRH
jgi:cyclic beta-1,2-glucan synthetase